MRPAFLANRQLALVYVVTLVVWLLVELRQAFHQRSEATNRDQGSRLVLAGFYVAGALLAGFAVRIHATTFGFNSFSFAASLGLMWSGIGLRWWSFRSLGHYFTFDVMTSPDQQVITTGPYRYIRHPSYTGLLLILAGIGVSYGNWLSVAALTLVPLIGFINRIQVEEAALTTTLGDAYTSYAGGRKRIIPFVW